MIHSVSDTGGEEILVSEGGEKKKKGISVETQGKLVLMFAVQDLAIQV